MGNAEWILSGVLYKNYECVLFVPVVSQDEPVCFIEMIVLFVHAQKLQIGYHVCCSYIQHIQQLFLYEPDRKLWVKEAFACSKLCCGLCGSHEFSRA